MTSKPHLPIRDSAADPGGWITARLNRLPASSYMWRLVVLLSLCGFFEIYEVALTAFLSPGLVRDGIFDAGSKGLFGINDQAGFGGATFLGFFFGTAIFASFADRIGRRSVLTLSLLWYVVCTVGMVSCNNAAGVDIWRLLAGIGVGVQLVAIDSYLVELVPEHVRGQAFAMNYSIMYLAVPTAAFLSWRLLPLQPYSIAGWRWVALFPVLSIPVILWVRSVVPESPRWLIQRGHFAEAERVLNKLEGRVMAQRGEPLPEPFYEKLEHATEGGFSELFGPRYRRRTWMLIVLNIFQAFGFYGFSNWVPTLLASEGITFVKTLEYSFAIALVYPLGPLVMSLFADRIETKWQIVIGALGTAAFGLAFAQQSEAAPLILFGALITVSNILLSYSYHAYQTALYPTQIRVRAVGFVYSFSRLATVLSGFAIAFVLRNSGSPGVFTFIASCMLIVAVAVAAFGPSIKGRSLEESSR